MAGLQSDPIGRLPVGPDLTLQGHPEVFVIGDLAKCVDGNGNPLPGIAPVAIQQGRYAARLISRRLRGKELPPFRYRDRGHMATIGRAKAVAVLGPLRLSGYIAWLAWLFVHLLHLVQFENRILALLQWAWNYFTWNRASRLITGGSPFPLVRTASVFHNEEPDRTRANQGRLRPERRM
jgi:NADH dehydrogenase